MTDAVERLTTVGATVIREEMQDGTPALVVMADPEGKRILRALTRRGSDPPPDRDSGHAPTRRSERQSGCSPGCPTARRIGNLSPWIVAPVTGQIGGSTSGRSSAAISSPACRVFRIPMPGMWGRVECMAKDACCRHLPRPARARSMEYRRISRLGQAWSEAASVAVTSRTNWPISPSASIASGRNVQKMWKACVGTG